MEELNREAKRIKVKAEEPEGKKRIKNPGFSKNAATMPVSEFRNKRSATKEQKNQTTNKDFAKDPNFIKACEKAGTPATKRQASKWRNKKGLAYKRGR